jgi:hypothetical protein
MPVLHSGNASAFQAEVEGPIPSTGSMFADYIPQGT